MGTPGYWKIVKIQKLNNHIKVDGMWAAVKQDILKNIFVLPRMREFLTHIILIQNCSIVNNKYNGWARICEQNMANKLGVSVRTIKKYVHIAEKLGFIRVWRERNPDTGKNEINKYRLTDYLEKIVSKAFVIMLQVFHKTSKKPAKKLPFGKLDCVKAAVKDIKYLDPKAFGDYYDEVGRVRLFGSIKKMFNDIIEFPGMIPERYATKITEAYNYFLPKYKKYNLEESVYQ